MSACRDSWPSLLLSLCTLALLAQAAPGVSARAADDAVEVKPPAASPVEGHAQPAPAAAPAPAPAKAKGNANIAEGGTKSAPATPDPAAVAGPAQPAPGGGGTASAPPPQPNQPPGRGAGNTADSNHAGPGASPRGNIAEGGKEAPGPGGVSSDHSLFSEEDFGLPGIAQGQPSEVPGSPSEVFSQHGPITGYDSPLGPSKVPLGEVQQRIAEANANPGHELDLNFGRIIVPTGSIVGSTKTKQFHIEGGLTIYYSDVTISGDTADIDEKQEIAVLKGNVSVIDPKYTLTADELRIRFEDKEFQATGFVQFKKLADASKSTPNLNLPKKQRLREYFAGQQFELYCLNLHYNWSTKVLHAVDSVRMVHPSFTGTMDRVDYDDKTKQYLVDGNVKLTVEKYDWIFDNGLVDPQDQARTKAVTDKPTTINCDRLVYSEDSGLAQFYAKPGAQVLFDQTDRTIKGSYMEVNDKTKDFHVEGTVSTPLSYDQTSGDWMFTGGLIKREEASPDLQNTLAKPLNATAQTLTYNFDRRRLEVGGAVKISADKKVLQADTIVQDDSAKFFLMRGNVLIQPDASSKIYAAQVFLDTANDVVSFVGLVQGTLQNGDIGTEAGGPVAPGEAGAPQTQAPSGLFTNTDGSLPGTPAPGGRTASAYDVQAGHDGAANRAEKR